MQDHEKSKAELLQELQELRRRLGIFDNQPVSPPLEATEQQKQPSEGQYRLLVEAASDFLWETNEDQVFVYANSRVEDILGYSPREVIGRSPYDFMSPEEANRVIRPTEEREDGFEAFEVTHLHKDGREIVVEVSATPIRDTRGRFLGMRGISRDVTERNHTQEALKRSEELFRAVFESSADCIIVWDRQYNYLYVNQAAITHVGVSRENVIGRNIRDGLGHIPDFMRLWMERVDRIFETGEPMRVGDVVPVGEKLVYSESVLSPIRDHDGNMFAVGVVYRDVTARKMAEMASQQSERQCREIVESVPDALFVLDPEWNIVEINPAACHLYGYSREELVGRHTSELIHPDHYGLIDDFNERAASGEQFYIEAVNFRKDSSAFPVEVWITQFSFRGTPHVLAVVRETTERKAAEKSLRKEQRHLKRLLEMHEQNRKLVAYEIHDGLVQSLVGARMMLETASGAFDADVAADVASDVRKNYEMGVRLLGVAIEQARELMGGQRPPILDERGLVAAIAYLVSDVTDYGEMSVEFSHDVRFDRLASPLETTLFRIVQESLSNAQRHSHSHRAEIRLRQEESQIRVEVEDWGIGFDIEGVAEECFGLEGIRERTRLFGGAAAIESVAGKGTLVSVELPLVEA